MTKLNILFLTPRFPFPLIGGDRLKAYYLLKHLALNHNVTLITFFQGKELKSEWVNELTNLGIDLKVIHINPVVAGIKCGLKLFTKYPLEILYYYNDEFQNEVDKVLKEKKIDIGFSFFMRTAEYLKDKNIKKILIAEDCRTLYQIRSYEESKNLKQKAIRAWEHYKLKTYEPEIMKHFDFTTFVTAEDANEMQIQNINTKIRILTNGTDTDYFKPGDFSKRKDILISGKLDIWSNIIMIKRIVYDILPKILSELPDVKLTIVGAKPKSEILALASENVIIKTNVPDFLPYLQGARLFLHPHLGGSGIQNKLIEAMSVGCPVITTNTGNQGINATDGIEAIISNENSEIALKAIEVLKNDDLALNLSLNARKLILKKQSWNNVFQQLDELIKEAFA